MAKKRAERTERRAKEHAERKATKRLIHDRERLAKLSPGGDRERPIDVPAASVLELRAEGTPCPQCEGQLRVERHRAVDGLRALDVRCQQCGVARTLWMRVSEPVLN